MPTKAKRRAPKTPKKKLWVHTFYLLQPLMQFAALVAVMLILARCSPLAPSTDRTSSVSASPGAPSAGDQAEALALEDGIVKSLKELNSAKAEVVSESDMIKLADDTAHVDEAIEESNVKAMFGAKNIFGSRKHRKVMYLPLTDTAQAALFRDNFIRIDLSERLHNQTKEKPMKLLLQNLRESMDHSDLGAAAYLVMPDATMQRLQGGLDPLNLTLKVSLSIPSDDRAFLEIRRVNDDPTAYNASLLQAALEETHQLAIILE